MIEITDEQFAILIDEAFETLPKTHRQAVKNVAITYQDEPSPDQREQLQLAGNETLFGLYEGVSLPRRMGNTGYGPDKITIFKGPITASARTISQLKEQIRHTLWHEIAHYFGLDHRRIHELEQ